MQHSIGEFIFFRSFVFVSGWINRNSGGPIQFDMSYGDILLRPMVNWVERPDLVPLFGEKARMWGFELRAVFPAETEHDLFQKLTLTIEADGTIVPVNRESPGLLVQEGHALWQQFLLFPKKSMIEIGARARSGITRKQMFGDCDYVGFDVLPGENVDICGDAHFLSEYVKQEVDAVSSQSTFEHLIMPWKVVEEINKVLRVGGLVFTQTHQTWPVHEAPWDFFRFSKEAWRGLFNEASGFRIIGTAQCEPVVSTPVYQNNTNAIIRIDRYWGYLSSYCLAEKVGPPLVSYCLNRALYDKIVGSNLYPA